MNDSKNEKIDEINSKLDSVDDSIDTKAKKDLGLEKEKEIKKKKKKEEEEEKKKKSNVKKMLVSSLLVPLLLAFGDVIEVYTEDGIWNFNIMLLAFSFVVIPSMGNWLRETFGEEINEANAAREKAVRAINESLEQNKEAYANYRVEAEKEKFAMRHQLEDEKRALTIKKELQAYELEQKDAEIAKLKAELAEKQK